MRTKEIKEMTTGSPFRLIFAFFVPLLLGMLFQQLYNIIDSMIVGQILGAKALGAVGGTGSINFMIIGFCMGVCNGFAIPVAQAVGAKNEKALKSYYVNSLWLASFFAIAMTVLVCALCSHILMWMDTPEDIYKQAYQYIFVIFLGIPAIYLYNLLSAIIRSFGDSKVPLYFLMIASVLNIILDLLFILVFHMGVSGAAWATIVSQGISGILCWIYINKKYKSILKIEKQEIKPDLYHMQKLCMIGIPMGLQYSITAIGSVILQTSVNRLGSTYVTAIAAGFKINGLFCCPFDALGSTIATYAGQNKGAGKYERITQGIKACSVIAIIYSIVACVILWLFGSELSLIFLKKEETLIVGNSALILKCLSVFYIPLAYVNIMRFAIQGMGHGFYAIIAGVLEMIGRSVVAFAFVPVYGYIAACFSSPVAWILADVFLIPGYFLILKKDIQKAKKRIEI